jgi:hypothetical protein
MNEKTAWPERVGCAGVVVDPARFEGRYPADKSLGGYVIILLDDDPLSTFRADERRGWSCVTEIETLTVSALPVSEGEGAE